MIAERRRFRAADTRSDGEGGLAGAGTRAINKRRRVLMKSRLEMRCRRQRSLPVRGSVQRNQWEATRCCWFGKG